MISRNETAAAVFGRKAWTCTAAPRPFGLGNGVFTATPAVRYGVIKSRLALANAARVRRPIWKNKQNSSFIRPFPERDALGLTLAEKNRRLRLHGWWDALLPGVFAPGW